MIEKLSKIITVVVAKTDSKWYNEGIQKKRQEGL